MFPGEIVGGVKPALIGRQKVNHFPSIRRLDQRIIHQYHLPNQLDF